MMRRVMLFFLMHFLYSNPMGSGAAGAMVARVEQEADDLISDLLLSASEHALDQFIKDCMWHNKYRTMDPDQKEKIRVCLKVKLAHHLMGTSVQEWKRLVGVHCTVTPKTPDHGDELDDFEFVAEVDNDSGRILYPSDGTAELDDF